jgi:Flagellar biosynthesis/type III secretory pathway protein
MTDNKLVNRIPFEEIETAQVWALPTLNNGKVIPSVKKPNPREEKKPETEIIEEVVEPEIKPLTAEQLQQIAAQAEEEGRERGYLEGLQKGYAEGEKKGLQKGEQKAYAEVKAALEDQRQRFQQIADALLDPLATQDSRLDNIILDMAVHLAKHLLNRELSEDPSSLFHLVERAVGALPAGAKNIRIYLHPDDVELAHEVFAAQGRNWTFYPDAKMSRGGCRLETDQSLLDYSVEQRLQQMLEQANFLGDLDAGEEIPVADYVPAPAPEPEIAPAPEPQFAPATDAQFAPATESQNIFEAPPAPAQPDQNSGNNNSANINSAELLGNDYF